jgi:hypothetical protein
MLNQVRTLGTEYVHDLIFIQFTGLQGEKAYGAFIMTASHNPGGPEDGSHPSSLARIEWRCVLL